jgi:hypothetical protein
MPIVEKQVSPTTPEKKPKREMTEKQKKALEKLIQRNKERAQKNLEKKIATIKEKAEGRLASPSDPTPEQETKTETPVEKPSDISVEDVKSVSQPTIYSNQEPNDNLRALGLTFDTIVASKMDSVDKKIQLERERNEKVFNDMKEKLDKYEKLFANTNFSKPTESVKSVDTTPSESQPVEVESIEKISEISQEEKNKRERKEYLAKKFAGFF